jgi:hypothetical protein
MEAQPPRMWAGSQQSNMILTASVARDASASLDRHWGAVSSCLPSGHGEEVLAELGIGVDESCRLERDSSRR